MSKEATRKGMTKGNHVYKSPRKITIEIDGITEAQELALRDLFAMWQVLGSAGSSRWTSFYADGDGNFRPKITVDGTKPGPFGTPEQIKARWHGDEYRMDFDEVAGLLRRQRESQA